MSAASSHASLEVTQRSAARLRSASFLVTVLFAAVIGLHLLLLGLPLDWRGAELPVAIVTFLLGAGALVVRFNSGSRVGAAACATGLFLLLSVFGAALSMLALRWGLPQADAALRAADAALGIDVPAVIASLSHWPAATEALRLVYGTSIPLLLLTIMALGLVGRQRLMWRACLMFGGTLLTICLGSGLVPAKGAFLFLDPAAIARLPEGAGTYAFETFDLFAAGNPTSLVLTALNGVACFPSFHTAAALILCQTGWSVRWLRPPLALWGSAVIGSTIPIGGHYVVDLVAGALVFAGWSRLTGQLAEGRVRPLVERIPEQRLART